MFGVSVYQSGHILQVNPAREKKLSNVRTTAADEKVFLAPPKAMTLEDAIGEATIGRPCNLPCAHVLLQAGLLIWFWTDWESMLHTAATLHGCNHVLSRYF